MSVGLRRFVASLIGVIALVGWFASPAAAHAAFESSDPSDGAVLERQADQVTLTFTGPVEPSGAGFEALDSSGRVQVPTASKSDDGATWTLTFEPALTGEVGLRWEVNAPDAHPISGSLTFEAPSLPKPIDPSPQLPDLIDSEAEELALTTSASDLEQFLEGDSKQAAVGWIGDIGRVLSIAGALLGVGALVFSVVVLRGEPADFGTVMYWLRRCALLLVVGTLMDAMSLVASNADGDLTAVLRLNSLSEALAGTGGLAIGARLFGGLLLLGSSRVPLSRSTETLDPVVRIRELVGAGVEFAGLGDRQPIDPGDYSGKGDAAWATPFTPAHPVLGALAIILSYTFDGHTVSKGTWSAMALLDAVHVFAGAVWVGGVSMLAVVLWSRHSDGREARAGQLAMRFSVVASASVVLVGAAGVAMAAMILDGPGQLVSTPWGRLLLAKGFLVAVAATAGAYNHYVLMPTLVSTPGEPGAVSSFRRAVAAEAGILVLVGVVTGAMVVSAT